MENNQIELLNKKRLFEEWIRNNVNNYRVYESMKNGSYDKHLIYFKNNDIPLFEEASPRKLRLQASKMLSMKDNSFLVGTTKYYDRVAILIAYSEYLEICIREKNSKLLEEINCKGYKGESLCESPCNNTNHEDPAFERDFMTLVCYISSFGDKALKHLKCKSYATAIDFISKKARKEYATVQKWKEEFDSYFEIGRCGECKKGQNEKIRCVFKVCKDLGNERFIETIEKILEKYHWFEKGGMDELLERSYMSSNGVSLYNVFSCTKDIKEKPHSKRKHSKKKNKPSI